MEINIGEQHPTSKLQEEHLVGKQKHQCPEFVNRQQHMHGVMVSSICSTRAPAIKTVHLHINYERTIWYPKSPLFILTSAK